MERICIYPKDIQLITGKSQRYGRLVIQKIKEIHLKEKKQLVTVEKFCSYSGLKIRLCSHINKRVNSHFANVYPKKEKAL